MKQMLIAGAMTLMMIGQACAETKQTAQAKKGEEMKQITPNAYTTFKVSDEVTMYQVAFKNQYEMNVAGHLFIPKNLD
ncbi:MAG: hypothetical protein RLZZ171_684, partial [Cyanobacteriota bacterium]